METVTALEQLYALNPTATKILLALVQCAEKNENLTSTIDNTLNPVTGQSAFKPVRVEILNTDIYEGWKVVKLSQYTCLFLRDPEIHFVVKDLVCVPFSFANDWLKCERIIFEPYQLHKHGKIKFTPTMVGHLFCVVNFANNWLETISRHQCLNI